MHTPQLIRALIETIRYMNKSLSTVKIIVSIREDLLRRIFRFTREVGDQEEKYESLFLKLKWNGNDLEKVIDYRVNQLLKDQYTNRVITTRDVLPKEIKKSPAIEYIINRTLRVPRDVIVFINACLSIAEGKSQITQRVVLAAEKEYSQMRLKALGDEWKADYTDLVSLVLLIFKQQNPSFRVSDVDLEDFELKLYDFLVQPRDESSDTYQWIYEGIVDFNQPKQLLFEMIKEFFKIGIVGVKLDTYREIYWSHLGRIVTIADLRDDTKCYIHPAFYSVLGIKPPQRNNNLIED